MTIRKTLFLLAAAAAGYSLVKSLRAPSAPSATPRMSPTPPVPRHVVQSEDAHARVAALVGDTLNGHHGEDAPFVHAFEDALAEEEEHERALAGEIGVTA